MKKDARQQAERVFLDAAGKISNVDIAKQVGVNPLTVGKWKKADDWTAKLTEKSEKRPQKVAPKAPRKKDAHDQALNLYLESEGKIGNTGLASKVGVSPNSIANWKRSERWAETLVESKKASSSDPMPLEEPAATVEIQVTAEAEEKEIEIDLEQLACPHHINELNKRIDDLLSQKYLSPTDLKTLAEAKEAVLGIVGAYIGIMERWSEN
jgi:uncharacterized protein YjcR